MSDEEDIRSEEEEGSEEEEESKAEDTGPSEAQLAMEKRRQQLNKIPGLDEQTLELLEAARKEREQEKEDIRLLREKRERRKRERQEEEQQLAKRRAEEDKNRKAEEEERRRKKDEEEGARREQRAAKMAEFEKWKNPTTPNFVISKKERRGGDEDDEEEEGEKKSKEQLEAEKKAILAQRVNPLEINGFDSSKLTEKAKELHNLLYRLESEKYDLEKRFKNQQYDMMELAERARQMNKVGKQGSLKRIQLSEEDEDKIQERFAGCPARIIMYSEYERQKDKREYGQRRGLYTGPVYGYAADRIKPQKIVKWNEEGIPLYEEMEGGAPPPAEEVEATGEEE